MKSRLQNQPVRAGLLCAAALALVLPACGGGDDDVAELAAAPSGTDEEESSTAEDAEAQLAAMQAMFPIPVDASLQDYDIVGPYNMTLQQAYCDGLPDCDSTEPDVHADIIQGQNGLELQIPNVLTAGLFSINGSLFAVTDSDQIANPCGSTPRNALVSVTIFADGVSIAADGTQTLTGLGASLLVEVDETGDCGEGVIFFAAQLIPE
jgi:hypothetical protein